MQCGNRALDDQSPIRESSIWIPGVKAQVMHGGVAAVGVAQEFTRLSQSDAPVAEKLETDPFSGCVFIFPHTPRNGDQIIGLGRATVLDCDQRLSKSPLPVAADGHAAGANSTSASDTVIVGVHGPRAVGMRMPARCMGP
jgi:hypothetical protein